MATSVVPSTIIESRTNAVWLFLSLSIVVLTATILFSYNLFGFPLYVGDEGIYMARAYAILNNGWLTPYTYWYDHAPAGWLLIAVWAAVSGGFETFGAAINSGRVLMLLLHIASSVLVFRIVYRQSADSFAATAAGLLYTLSPLVLLHGRTVRLDNIMIFWALLATALMLGYSGKLWTIIWSGVFLGIAALTKENAILLAPAFVYALSTTMRKTHARFASAGWLFAAISIVSLYPLYASLRDELYSLDLSSPIAGSGGPVSLLGTALWQLGRSGGWPWDPTSDFYHFLTTDWLINDPWILGLGVIAILWNLMAGDHRRRTVALLGVMSLLGIAHGNQVFEYYIISVLPFLALNFGLALGDIARRTNTQTLSSFAAIGVIALGWLNLAPQHNLFSTDINRIHRQAVTWLRDHVTPDSQLVGDDQFWVDLRRSDGRHQGFAGTHSHWQVALDPAISNGLFHGDWKFIDYLVVSPGMESILTAYPDKIPYQAFQNSTPIVDFSYGDAVVEIRRVNHAGLSVREMLTYSYEGFKERYISSGQVRPDRGYTDARDQAGALLMAVWMNDQDTFNEIWTWTTINLQSDTGLLFHSTAPGATAQSATEADTDAALALLLAERKWNDSSYGRHAGRILDALWREAVVKIDGKPYLAAGDWAVSPKQVIFAPATFAPYAYHFFAQADPEHEWWYLLDTQYKLLEEITAKAELGLPPALVSINRRTGRISFNLQRLPDQTQVFNDYAAQVFWRVGLDAQWHDDTRADDYLMRSDFLTKIWQTEGQLASVYSLTGQPQTTDESLMMYSTVLPKLLIQNPDVAHQLYATKLAASYRQNSDDGQWGDNPTLTQERWAWLTAGLYAEMLDY